MVDRQFYDYSNASTPQSGRSVADVVLVDSGWSERTAGLRRTIRERVVKWSNAAPTQALIADALAWYDREGCKVEMRALGRDDADHVGGSSLVDRLTLERNQIGALAAGDGRSLDRFACEVVLVAQEATGDLVADVAEWAAQGSRCERFAVMATGELYDEVLRVALELAPGCLLAIEGGVVRWYGEEPVDELTVLGLEEQVVAALVLEGGERRG